jgi:hypothetical protein
METFEAATVSLFSFLGANKQKYPFAGRDMVTFHFSIIIYSGRSRNSVVGIATGYGPDDHGVGVRVPVW